MRETAREVAAAKIKRAGDALGELCKAIWAGDFREGWHWEIPANHEKDTDCIIGDGMEAGTQGWAEVARLEAALTAERDARERAERERDGALTRLAHAEADAEQAVWSCQQEIETLRERVAVLRAECQAGRELQLEQRHERECAFVGCGEGCCVYDRLVSHSRAIAATDAAGAMGEVERG